MKKAKNEFKIEAKVEYKEAFEKTESFKVLSGEQKAFLWLYHFKQMDKKEAMKTIALKKKWEIANESEEAWEAMAETMLSNANMQKALRECKGIIENIFTHRQFIINNKVVSKQEKQLEALVQELEALDKKQKQYQEKFNDLNIDYFKNKTRFEALKNELRSLLFVPAATRAPEINKKIKEVEQKISKIKPLIDERDFIYSELKSTNSNYNTLKKEYTAFLKDFNDSTRQWSSIGKDNTKPTIVFKIQNKNNDDIDIEKQQNNIIDYDDVE